MMGWKWNDCIRLQFTPIEVGDKGLTMCFQASIEVWVRLRPRTGGVIELRHDGNSKPENGHSMSFVGARVKLRQWLDTDVEAFAAMNADPKVMEFFPEPLTREQSVACLKRLQRNIDANGWGLWAVEIEGALAGFTGLAAPAFEAHFRPCIEIGWRFHHRFWGHGYALEASRLAVGFAFESLRLKEVVSFTARLNERSERLMQRLGMTHSRLDDFEHPLLPVGHALRPHVLYRIQNDPRWFETRQ